MLVTLLAKILKDNFEKVFLGGIFANQTSLSISLDKDFLNFFIYFLKNSSFFQMTSLVDMFALDFLGRSTTYRFLVYYVFYSRKYGITMTVKVYIKTYEILLTSTNIFASAGWLEREIYDMFGIFFYKNEDMRRILSDYGFEGFPLRKDFPLTGFFELYYSEEEKVVVSMPAKINQALRLFHFSAVWDFTRKI